jgi:hypothetical protein
MKGNCCAGRERSVERMVTTAGETLLTRSAYDVCTPATLVAAGAGADAVGARLTNLLWPLHDANANTTKNKLKKMFSRETAPL